MMLLHPRKHPSWRWEPVSIPKQLTWRERGGRDFEAPLQPPGGWGSWWSCNVPRLRDYMTRAEPLKTHVLYYTTVSGDGTIRFYMNKPCLGLNLKLEGWIFKDLV